MKDNVTFTREDCVLIQGFMVTDLELSGTDLIIYALIYGHSNDGINRYKASLNYLSGASKVSRSSAIRSIERLEEKGFIICVKGDCQNPNEYYADLSKTPRGGSVKMTLGSVKMTLGSVKMTLGSDKETSSPLLPSSSSSLNNPISNTNPTLLTQKETERNRIPKGRPELEAIASDPSFGFSDIVIEAFKAFLDMRDQSKKRPTPYAMKNLCAKVKRTYSDDNLRKKMIDQSTENGWTGLYEIKKSDIKAEEERKSEDDMPKMRELTMDEFLSRK